MPEKVAVLGGGISGLAAAFFLKELGHQVQVLEKEKEVGGMIKSILINGFTCEMGPNTVLINNPSIHTVLKKTNLDKKTIQPTPEAGKNRYILKNGAMLSVPTSLTTFLSSPLLSSREKFRLLREPLIGRSDAPNPSLADFIRHRMGKGVHDNLLEPFATGIYAGNTEEMSAKHALSFLYKAEKQHGSIFRGMLKKLKEQKKTKSTLPKQKMFTLPGGLQTLPKAMAEYLENDLKTDVAVRKIVPSEKGYRIHTMHQNQAFELEVDRVISALPSHQLAKLVNDFDPHLVSVLGRVKYAPVSVLHIAFDKKAIRTTEKGFGLLSRPEEKTNYLGILFNSRTFPHCAPENTELFTVIAGGARRPDLNELPDQELEKMLIEETQQLLSSEPPVFARFTRWKRGIPQYSLGHDEVIKATKQFEQNHPGFYICGNFLEGLSVSDCIENAHNLVQSFDH